MYLNEMRCLMARGFKMILGRAGQGSTLDLGSKPARYIISKWAQT